MGADKNVVEMLGRIKEIADGAEKMLGRIKEITDGAEKTVADLFDRITSIARELAEAPDKARGYAEHSTDDGMSRLALEAGRLSANCGEASKELLALVVRSRTS